MYIDRDAVNAVTDLLAAVMVFVGIVSTAFGTAAWMFPKSFEKGERRLLCIGIPLLLIGILLTIIVW